VLIWCDTDTDLIVILIGIDLVVLWHCRGIDLVLVWY